MGLKVGHQLTFIIFNEGRKRKEFMLNEFLSIGTLCIASLLQQQKKKKNYWELFETLPEYRYRNMLIIFRLTKFEAQVKIRGIGTKKRSLLVDLYRSYSAIIFTVFIEISNFSLVPHKRFIYKNGRLKYFNERYFHTNVYKYININK